MKRALHLLSLTAMLGASVAVGQTVETFESFADNTALRTVWPRSSTAATGDDPTLGSTGGANGTNQYLIFNNGGFGVAAKASNIITPAAGAYKISFYYKNGLDALASRNLTFKISEGSMNVLSIPLSGATPNPAVIVNEWTPIESAIFELNGGPVSIEITASDAAGTYKSAFDEIVLTPILDVPLGITVFPDDRIYLSRTESITPSITGGSETYTQVAYDVENDGDTDFLSITAPFTFNWNTLGAMPQDTSGTVALKVTVTDSENDTASVTEIYTIDNRFAGRESMITNGDFSSFAGTGVGTNLPAGWVENFVTPNSTYGAGPGRNPETGNALQITFAASASEPTPEFRDRYTLRTVSKVGNYRDLQTTWWGKGIACRLYYFTSEDGATFVNTFQDAGQANDANWIFVVDPVQDNALVNLSDTSHVALATHMLGSSSAVLDHLWDDITWEGILIPQTSEVEGWNLY